MWNSSRSEEGQAASRDSSLDTCLSARSQVIVGESPQEAKSQFLTTPIGSTKNWVRSVILPYQGLHIPEPVPPTLEAE
jgi:hypothetical protein